MGLRTSGRSKPLGFALAVISMVTALAVVSMVVFTAPLSAQEDRSRVELLASDSELNDLWTNSFGSAVAVGANGLIAVGAPLAQLGDELVGAVYLYTPLPDGTYVETKLTASDGEIFDDFGASVALGPSGEVVVGASDKAYVFTPTEQGSYTETKLVGSEMSAGDDFGAAVAINSQGTIAIGAPGHGSERQGTVYLFTPSAPGTYAEERLIASSPTDYAEFGTAVSFAQDDTLVVGAPAEALGVANKGPGAVHVLVREAGGGFSEQVLTSPTDQDRSSLGWSVDAATDGTIVAGNPVLADTYASVFRPDENGEYTEVRLGLQPGEQAGADDRSLGRSVAISDSGAVLVGGEIISGALLYSPDGSGGYVSERRLAEVSGFGMAVALSPTGDGSDDGLVIGAPYRDGGGAVYVYGPRVTNPPRPADQRAVTELVLSQQSLTASLGAALAIGSDGQIVAGAPDFHGPSVFSSGAIAIYSPTPQGDYEQTVIEPSDPTAGGRFGSGVAVTPDGAIVVSAPQRERDDSGQGKVYLFTPNGDGSYTESTLSPSEGAGVFFLEGVAAGSDGSIFVGSEHQGLGAIHRFVPDGDGGFAESLIVPEVRAMNDRFGRSFAVGNDGTIVVDSVVKVRALVPQAEGDFAETTLRSYPDNDTSRLLRELFFAVTDSGVVVVGRPQERLPDQSSLGIVSVYTPNDDGDFTEATLVGDLNSDNFGASVAVGPDETIVVGAPVDFFDPGSGRVFVFSPDGLGGFSRTRLDTPTDIYNQAFGGVVAVGPSGEIATTANRGLNTVYVLGDLLCGGLEVTVDLAAGEVPTAGPDVISGTPGADVIAAGDGDDVICGYGGADVIWGQGGDDSIFGGPGDDRLRGGPGDDLLRGGEGADNLNGSAGNDSVHGDGGDDPIVRGGTGDDFITGGLGNDELLSGNGGRDSVYGDSGSDRVVGGPRPDQLWGGAGSDQLEGRKGADQLSGGAGDDELRGGPQPDSLDGGSGMDMCLGGTTGEPAPESDAAINCEAEFSLP